MKARHALAFTILVLSILLLQRSAFGQGTAFTYQGQLQSSSSPANGSYNLTFSLFATNTGGAPVAGPVTNRAVNVTNGLFTVIIDFGSSVWNGATNWLEIGVETNGGGEFITLSPRQEVTPTPYAVAAGNLIGPVSGGGLSGTYGGVVNFTNPADSFSGNGAGLTGVNAAAVGGLTASNLWTTTGNSGTSPTNGNFVGTTDFQPLELKAGGMRVLRLEPDPRTNVNGVSGNLIGGYTNNLIEQPGSGGDFIGGGGYPGGPNVIYSNSSGVFIGAGSANQVGPNLNDSFIGAGYGNNIQSAESVIAGGYYNAIQGDAAYSAIGGGYFNTIQLGAGDSAIAGGSENNILVECYDSTIAGGYSSSIGSPYSIIGGGYFNTIQTYAAYSTIAGGADGSIGSYYDTIGGGGENTIGTNSNSGTISGGFGNTIDSDTFDSSIGGGSYHTIGTNSYYSTIAGGRYNSIGNNATASSIGGGFENTIQTNAPYATIPGGYLNTAAGSYSFAAGDQAQANHTGAFVWADASTNSGFGSTTSNQFNVRATGGVRFVTGGAGMTVDGAPVTPSGNYVFAYSTAIENVFTPGNFQDASFNFEPVLSGWTINAGSSQFLCPQSGVYLVQYTAEAYITDSLSLRAALNEIEIPGSQTYAYPQNGAPTMVVSKSFLVSINAASFLTIQFTGNSPSDRLQGGGFGTVQPCLSLTITRIQ